MYHVLNQPNPAQILRYGTVVIVNGQQLRDTTFDSYCYLK